MKIILPTFNLNIEKWKWNKEYRIYVSNQGHFKDEYKKLIPIKINQSGYVIISTRRGLKYAHRLVLLTWSPIPNAEDLTIDHLDHNKRNNNVNNLEWVTKEENLRRAFRDNIYNIDSNLIINNDFYILCNDTKLYNWKEVFDFVKSLPNYKKRKNISNENASIKSKVLDAIIQGTKYQNKKWKIN